MASRRSVQNTHIGRQVRQLHGALLEIMSVMNRPQQDEAVIAEAGIRLDRALFPLLVGIERYGPIGVVDAADRVGRDYTTVSRQMAKLEELGLIARRPSATDARSREAVATAAGQAMVAQVDAARERLAAQVFADWDGRDVDELVRLMTRLAAAMSEAGRPFTKH